VASNDFLADRYGNFLKNYAQQGFIDKKTGKTYQTKEEATAAGALDADLQEGVVGVDMNLIQEEFFSEFLQDMARGLVDVKIQKSLLNKIKGAVNSTFGTNLTTSNPTTDLIEILSRMSSKLAKGEDIFQEAYQIKEIMEDGLGITAIDATQVEPTTKKRKGQIIAADGVSTYSMKDVLDRVGGRMIVITSDNTGVGIVNGKLIQGGLFYSFLPENIRDGVGFASVDIKSVKTVMNFIDAIAPNGEDVAVFIMQQNPTAMLGNFYAADFFADSIMEVIPAEMIPDYIRDFDAINSESKGVMKTIKNIPVKALDRQGKEIAPDTEFGYGKRMGGDIYMEASFMAEDMPDFVNEAAKKLPEGFEFKIVKFNTKTQAVSFIQSPDFDTAYEPTVGDSIRVYPDGSIKRTAGRVSNKQIYHHKWTMVRPTDKKRGWGASNNYKGFNYSDSKERSILMQEVMLKNEDPKVALKIGNQDFWSANILPSIEALYTANGKADWSKVGTWKKGQEANYKSFISTLEKGRLTKEELSAAIDKMSFKFRNEIINLHLPLGVKVSNGVSVNFKDTSMEVEPQGSLIKKALSKSNKTQAQFFMKYSQPNFASEAEILSQLNGDWGYVYSGFITNSKLDFGKEFQETKGVTHEQFNAKIPSKENFLLDSGYEISERFKGVLEYKDSEKQPEAIRNSIAGSMFMGTRSDRAKANVVNIFNAELGGEKAGLTTRDVIEGLAKKRIRTTSNKVTPTKEGTWFVSQDFEAVIDQFPDLYKSSIDEDAEASGVGNETQVATNNGSYQKMIDYFASIDPQYQTKVFADINGGLGSSNQLKYENGIENYQVIEPFYDKRRFPVYTMTLEDAGKAVALLGLKQTEKPHTELNKFVKNDANFDRLEVLIRKGQLPTAKLTPDYVEQNGYDIPSESLDYAMSNAVLNVIPGDVRQDVVLNFGRALKVGGKGFISTRGTDVLTNKSNVSLSEDPLEFYVAGNTSYQKGFKPKELEAYIQDVLGKDFKVSVFTKLSSASKPTVLVERVSNETMLEGKFVFQSTGAKRRKLNTKAVFNSVSMGLRSDLGKLGFSSWLHYSYQSKAVDVNGVPSWYHHITATDKASGDVSSFIIRTANHDKPDGSSTAKGDVFLAKTPFREIYSFRDPAREELDRNNKGKNIKPDNLYVLNIFDHASYKKVVDKLIEEGFMRAGTVQTGITDWEGFFSRKTVIENLIDSYNSMEEADFIEMLQKFGYTTEDANKISGILSRESMKIDSQSENYAQNLFGAFVAASKNGKDAQFLSNMLKDIDVAIEDGEDLDALFDKYEARLAGNEKSKKNLLEKVKKVRARFDKEFLDRQITIKKALQEIGAIGVEDLLVTAAGSSGWAKFMFSQYEKQIYGNLSNRDLKILDQIIFAKRVIQIDSNFDARGKKRPKHPNGFTKEKAEAALRKLSMQVGIVEIAELNKRADDYFDAMREQFEQAYNAGLITEEAYEALRNDDYAPRRFLDFVLNPEDNTFREGTSVKEFIKELNSGSNDDLILDSKYLLQVHIKQTQEKIFKNRMSIALADEIISKTPGSIEWAMEANYKQVPDGKMVDLSEPGEEAFYYQPEKSLVASPDRGYVNMYFYRNGVMDAIQIKKEYRDEFLDLEILGRAERYGTAGKALAGINSITRMNATGAGNPLFFLRDFFRNWQYAIFRSDVYGRSSFTVSSIKLFKDLWGAGADKVLVREDYVDLAKHGGLMDFLSTDSNPWKNLAARRGNVMGWAKKKIAAGAAGLTYMSETTEIAFRIAVYKRDLAARIEKFNLENKREPDADELEGIKFAAARSAREILDFSQGGLTSKDVDKYIKPYFNVAIQGAKGIAEVMVKDPAKFIRYSVEAGSIAAMITYLRLAMGDDEDEANLSEYFKRKYFIFWKGEKKEDGSRDFVAVPKAEQLSGFMRVFEMMMEKEIKGDGAFDNWSKEDWMSLSESFSMFLPVTGLTDFAPPLYQAYRAYDGNWDMFREAVVTGDFEQMMPKTEGIDDDRIEYFYKAVGDALGMSPARMKASIEKVTTTPSNSIFVSGAYNMADFIARKSYEIQDKTFPTTAVKEKSKALDMSVLVEAFNPKSKFIKKTNPNARFFIEDLKAKEIELREGSEFKGMKMFVNDLTTRFLKEDMTLEGVQAEIDANISEDDLKRKAFSFFKSAVRREDTGINSNHWDVFSAKSAELQAYYLVKHFKEKEDIEQEMSRMKMALNYRPAIGLKEELEKLLQQTP
jgi:hypothetical protein